MRYLMIVSYDGKNYSGFQKQKQGETTVQSVLENAVKIITKKETNCVPSGRTDAKVSAYAQPVHIDTITTIDCEKFLRSINGILPDDIKVLSINEFTGHARFTAKRKTYVYKMYISNIEQPLLKDALQVSPKLNFKEMKKFLKLIVGTHDFAGFMASGSKVETTVRTIYKAKLKQENDYFNFYVTGNGFLYKMVRRYN